MTDADQTCEVCDGGSKGLYAGVACIPGVPISVAWCLSCVERSAVPLFVVEVNAWSMGFAADRAEPWFLEQTLWVDGKYVTVREWMAALTEEQKLEIGKNCTPPNEPEPDDPPEFA